MNKILSSLKQSFQIKNKKLLFLLLFIIQIGFFAVIIYLFIHYYTVFIESLDSVIQGIEQISPDSLPGMQQTLALYANMKNTTNILFTGLLAVYLAYALVNSLNWDFTNLLLNKKLGFPKYEIHFAVLAFIFLLPAMIMTKIVISSLVKIGFPEPMQVLFYLILLITWYFMMISFALINKYDLSQLKQHLKQTFIIGCKKAKILIPTCLIIIAVLALFIYLISLLQDVPYLHVVFEPGP